MNYNSLAYKDKILELCPIENPIEIDYKTATNEEKELWCEQFNRRERKLRDEKIGNLLVVYLIVRKSLDMSAGKIAGQCGHAIHYLCDLGRHSEYGSGGRFFGERFNYWHDSDFHTKVVLEASDKEWVKLKEEYDPIIVVDAGKTEIVAGSETVMVLFPMLREERTKTLKRCQAL